MVLPNCLLNFYLANDLVKTMIGKENIELLGIPEIREILLDSNRLSLLEKLGMPKDKIEEVLLEKRILRLAKKLFGKDITFVPSFRANGLEYDIVGCPKTQNAVCFDKEMAAIGAIKRTLKGVLMALDKEEQLEEDL